MPVTLKLRFPGGRYHATPWGRHVNEGVPEWPPSPWRLLRSLVAVWKRTCPESVLEGQVKRMLSALTRPPLFQLPRHKVAHTRHYMPWEKKGPADRTLVFDTFVAVGRNEWLYVHWPDANLSADDENCLRRLASNLSSLGRAEGWVEAELTTDQCEPNCIPGELGHTGEGLVPVLCPDPDTAFAADHYPTHDPEKLRKGKVNPKEFLFDCPRWHLCLDTQTIHAERWPRVPGARWVNYALPKFAPTLTRSTPTARPNPTVARFLLDAPVLPQVTDAVRIAEAFRAAAMSRFASWCRAQAPAEVGEFSRPGRTDEFSSPVLAGKTPTGEMLTSHDHAHYLPTAEGDDPRRVTHLTVYAPAGLGPGERAALTALRAIRVGAGDPLRAQLVGLGSPNDFTAPLFRSSTVWESVTPFVAHRHPKRRGSKKDTPHLTGPDPKAAFVELAVRELVALRRVGRLVAINPLPTSHGGHRSVEFWRTRSGRGEEGWRRPHGFFVLQFDSPVSGPLSLGYACHYGLGLFQPA